MKTKHIFAAMVLPTLFAACTAEEFTENNSSISVADRALLKPFVISVGQAPESRFGWSEEGVGNWTWEKDDAFSAFLVDNNWTATDYLYTNYVYKSENGASYETTSQMVEGIYWFYAPSPENKNDRGLISFKLETSQDKDYYKSEAGQVFVTGLYKLTKEDDPQNLPLSLTNYYSRAVFPLANNTDAAIKIKQIVLENENGEFDVEGKISTANLKEYMYAFNEEGELVSAYNLDEDQNNDETLAELKDRLSKADMVLEDGKKSSNIIVLNLGDGAIIEAGAKKEFTMLVPRTEPNTTCSIKIVTDQGVIEIDATDKSNYAKNVQFVHNGVKPMFGFESDKSFKSYSIVENSFENLGDTYYVGSYDEMMALVNTVNGSFSVYNLGGWDVDAAMAKAIANSDSYVTFSQPTTIKDAKETVSLNKVVFDKGLTIAEGTKAIFEKSNVADTHNKVSEGLTVEKGAEVEFIGGTFNSINNAGKIVVNAGATVKGVVSTGDVELVNSNIPVTINGGSLTYSAEEGKNAIFGAGSLTLPNELTDNINITVNKNVSLKIGKETALINKYDDKNNLVYTTKLVNNGTIITGDVDCTLIVNGEFENNGTVTLNAGKLIINGKLTNAEDATINNVTVEADGTVENNGIMLSVNNNGTITTGAYSRTTITGGAGTIDNTAKAYIGEKSSALQNQTVEFRISHSLNTNGYNVLKVNELVSVYKVNKLIFANKLTVDDNITIADGIKTIDFADGSNVYVNSGKTLTANAEDLKVNILSTVKFDGFDETSIIELGGSNSGATINVKKNCTLSISYCTVQGAGNNKLEIISEDVAAGDPVTFKRGQVVNKGVVKGAKEGYNDSSWWTGTAASVSLD